MNRKNIDTLTFLKQRELGISKHQSQYWYLRLKNDFGVAIAQRSKGKDYRLFYQDYYYYCDFLRSTIIEIESLRDKDIFQFFLDKNIGQGKIQKELLRLLLSKPGAFEACCYENTYNHTVLAMAARSNKECFELIKNKFLPDNEHLLNDLLEKENISGMKPLDYLSLHQPIKFIIPPPEKNNFFSYVRADDADLLNAAIAKFGNEAKEMFLNLRDCYNSNILHIAAEYSSVKCLNVISKIIGEDIQTLYSNNWPNLTPVGTAAKNGSLECLQTILQLFKLPLEAALLEQDDSPSSLVKMVIASGDIAKIQFILGVSKEGTAKIRHWFANNPHAYPLIMCEYHASATPFFLLNQIAEFDKDCNLIKKFTNENHLYTFFSTYYTVMCHVNKLEKLQQPKVMGRLNY